MITVSGSDLVPALSNDLVLTISNDLVPALSNVLVLTPGSDLVLALSNVLVPSHGSVPELPTLAPAIRGVVSGCLFEFFSNMNLWQGNSLPCRDP